MTINGKELDLIKPVLALIIIVAAIYISLSTIENHSNKKKVDSLQTVIKIKEASARGHEMRAAVYNRKAANFEIVANNLKDSISQVDKERLKWKQLYENSTHNPIRFTRDSQRDSIFAVLYPR